MILNELQLEASKKHLSDLTTWISVMESEDQSTQDQFRKLELLGLQEFATDIRADIEEYEELCAGNFEAPPPSVNFMELPKILVQTRIAIGWTQEQLANHVHSKLSQIKKYEQNLYFGASIFKKFEIAEALDVDTSGLFLRDSEDNESSQNDIALRRVEEIKWNDTHVEEAFSRGWIPREKEGITQKAAFKAWFLDINGPYISVARHSENIANEISSKQSSQFAWQARVLQLAKNEIRKSPLPEFRLDERWIKKLVKTTAKSDAPAKVKQILGEQGIIFVIERHLPKTRLDGAALLSHEGVPIIALTLRHNRLDYFWFTLFHELGHVYRHLFSMNHFNFFDRNLLNENIEVSNSIDNSLEGEAHQFASEELIPPEDWRNCLSRTSPSEHTVMEDAKNLCIHPSIIAGRIRKERNDDKILTSLVGHGKLHKHF